MAIANESANYTIFGAAASSGVVLQTFIGGAGTFFGPALGAAVMTFFARVTSDLTRSWLLYQGLIFVFIMLFAPDGIGGLISLHSRKLKAGGWRHLVLPYLVCLTAGMLLIAGVVFTVESIHLVLSDAYIAKRTAAKGAWVPYQLFGTTHDPSSPLTWAIPIGLLAAGSLLLIPAMKITQRAWLRATTGDGDAPEAAPAGTAASHAQAHMPAHSTSHSTSHSAAHSAAMGQPAAALVEAHVPMLAIDRRGST